MWKFVQVEFHPKLYQKELLEYCKRKGIQLQAYTSLGQGKVCYSAWTFYYCDHVYATLIDIKYSIDIEKIIKTFYFKHTCIYVQQMVSPSKLQLIVALGKCKLDDSSVLLWLLRKCTMEVIMHADDNFLFRDSHNLGLRKICKLLLVYLTFNKCG